MTDEKTSDLRPNYALRQRQRRAANDAATARARFEKFGRADDFTKEDRLTRQVKVLGDRLVLALHIMTFHEQFISYESPIDQMKYLEEWTELLLGYEEPAMGPNRPRDLDFYRTFKRYGYLRNAVRRLLRDQIHFPPDVPTR